MTFPRTASIIRHCFVGASVLLAALAFSGCTTVQLSEDTRAVGDYKLGTLIVKPAQSFDNVRDATKLAFQDLGYFLVLDELKLPGRATLKARDPQDTSIEVKLESAGSHTKIKIRHGLRGQLAPEQRLFSAIEKHFVAQ
jgi:hypothetical protein